ncbi:hypothetical protein [Roseococcus sp.]|uniref:hypothetical protein n=1 Tax=Roseococcus sp. TaxID=2109646 RepID=UPI003BA85A89
MKLVDFFAKLSFGELRNLALANEGDGTITEAGQPTIVHFLNEGLKAIYGDFLLIQKDLLVLMREDITNYHLLPRFAVQYEPLGSRDNEPFRYILDLPDEPFLGDVVRILAAFDSYGEKLPLNDQALPDSLFTPQLRTLQVPRPVDGAALSVLYQAAHPKIVGDLEEEVEIPDNLEEALLEFVAYKVFSSMNTAVSTAKGIEHFQRYTAICAGVVSKDLVSTSIVTTNTRFEQRGFV